MVRKVTLRICFTHDFRALIDLVLPGVVEAVLLILTLSEVLIHGSVYPPVNAQGLSLTSTT